MLHRAIRSICGVALLAAAVTPLQGCRDAAAVKQQAFERGQAYLQRGAYKEAIIEFRKSLQKDGRFGEARFGLAQAYEGADEIGNAYREFVTAAELMPDRRDVQLKAGRLLVFAREFDQAKACADRLLAKDPKDVDGLLLRGNALAGLQDLDGALAEVQNAIGLNPGNSAAFTNLAVLRMTRGEKAAAEAAFRQALTADPKSVDAALALAHYYWESGQQAMAEEWFTRAATDNPTSTRANRATATFLMSTGDPMRAEPYMKKYAELSTDDAPKLALADFYVVTRQQKEARALLEQMVGQPNPPADAIARLAAVRHAAGEKAEAHAALDAVIARNPNDLNLMLLKTALLTTDGRLDEALARATAAVNVEPRSPAAHYSLGLVRVARKERDEAIRAFNDVLAIAPSAADAELQLAELHLAAGSADAAAQHAAVAVKAMPNSLLARMTFVRALLARRDVAALDEQVKWLGAAAPQLPEVDALQGNVLALRGDLKGARAAFERALVRQPGLVEAVSGLVVLDLAAGQREAARTRLAQELARKRDNVALLMLASKTYLQLGDLPAAEPLLRRAIELDAAHLDAYSLLGQLFAMQGRLDNARAEFEAMAARAPQSVPAHTMIAMILHAQNRPDETKKAYQKVLQIDPRAPVAANNLAWLMAESGDNLDVALQLAQVATEGLPDRPEIGDTLGWVYYRKGLGSLAAQTFARTVERDPTNPLYLYHLGLAYQQQGQMKEARAALEKSLRLKPNFPGSDDARRRLEAM
jgi:tetratricopeptide (TPR) repeat protein